MDAGLSPQTLSLWEKHVMALDDVTARFNRIKQAFEARAIPYALVGGQAVALWVATIDPSAVRTTKDVDLLVKREDLPKIRAAALAVGMEYFEVMGVGMLLEKSNPNPRHAVRYLWAGEKVRSDDALSSPSVEERIELDVATPVIPLASLVGMKLMANRDQDRVHLRDLIDVGLATRQLLVNLPADLAARLDSLLTEMGR